MAPVLSAQLGFFKKHIHMQNNINKKGQDFTIYLLGFHKV